MIRATILAFVALTVSGCSSESNLPAVLSGAELENMQELATHSCQCARSNPDDESCWREYRQATAELPFQSEGTACAPVSTHSDCIESEAGWQCITTGYDANIAETGNDIALCTRGEALAVERAYYDAFESAAGEQDAHAEGSRAANDVLRQIAAGEEFGEQAARAASCI